MRPFVFGIIVKTKAFTIGNCRYTNRDVNYRSALTTNSPHSRPFSAFVTPLRNEYV